MDALRQPRRASTLAAQVADQLREQLATGKWPVGTRIPGELELAGLLQVSRNTVREALRALVHLGLLESRVGDGTYVRVANELEAVLLRRTATTRPVDVLELRAVLEEHAAGLAAERRSQADIARLREVLAAVQESNRSGSMTQVAAADGAFHRAVVQAGGNELLGELYDYLGSALSSLLTALPWDDDVAVEHDHWHGALVDAVAAGDAVAARYAASMLVRVTSRLADEAGQDAVAEHDDAVDRGRS
ncbi:MULTISPECIES: FadR/GntR family transcriptional regulator [unclassified Streptomyces]|uniref:FadR/GntR family transcriptional regulator n=1 Tax=Streptomyces sanglieri TaxID=193460 RepID=A0ABW2WNF7_9ACTN|nr:MULTISPECIES: FCD domain-containing protein [unclassified Streptomyces]MDV9195246.1 FCD domain-containing protein [Streptomyces sp. Wh19]SCF68595.1 transcriptional regulator, GntR family [Streptomyces sp. Ncost-T10-10d]